MPLRHRLKAPRQNALLRVQAIFGLVEHHRLRTVDHLVGDFVTAMSGKAMHEQRVGFRQRHQLGVDLIRLQQIVAGLPRPFPPREPGVGGPPNRPPPPGPPIFSQPERGPPPPDPIPPPPFPPKPPPPLPPSTS